MIPPEWAAQKLAEFLAAVSAYTSEPAAALGAVERVAEALDAEVAAIVEGGELVAAIGYPAGEAPVAELDAVARGTRHELTVPGSGLCSATVVVLEHPPGARLVVARWVRMTCAGRRSGSCRGWRGSPRWRCAG